MFDKPVNIPIPGGLDVGLPKVVRVAQNFEDNRLPDIRQAVRAEFGRFAQTDLRGKSVALGVGSRGIRQQLEVVVPVIDCLKEAGADPFVVPAMGSHGGGTAEGQEQVLAHYGYTEDTLGAPIRSSMDVVQIGALADGLPLYCDRLAFEADYMVPVNRVKPHTDFKATHESGLIKMLAIGLGKHKGAVAFHDRGFENFHALLPEAGQVFLDKARILFGVAMVENAFDQVMRVELVPPPAFHERDRSLLALAKSYLPRLPFSAIDVLVLHQIGKNISGAGLDPNVTGRTGTDLPGFDAPPIECIVVLDLTEETHGNATGVGLADITTHTLLQKVDWETTYVNCVTAGSMAAAALPLVAATDAVALQVSMRCCRWTVPDDVRMVVAANTLDLHELLVSEALIPEVEANTDLTILGAPEPLRFDDADRLVNGR